MGPGPGRDGRDRQARGSRTRVPHPAEAHRDRPEQLQRPGGRQHGPLELHITPSPGRAVRTPQLLSDVSWQEWRVRGRRVPAEGRSGPTATQTVRSMYKIIILAQAMAVRPPCAVHVVDTAVRYPVLNFFCFQ